MMTVDTQIDRDDRQAFGAFLASLRLRVGAKKIKQTRILAHLPNWVHSSYSRLEDGMTSPRFNDLPVLYAAFLDAGVVFSPPARQQFVALARKRIELQQTYKDRRTDAEWAQLLLDLMRLDGQAEIEQKGRLSQPFLADVGHLVDRPLWHEELKGLLSPARGKKLVIVRGSAGVGKSSELSRLAIHLLGQSSYQMIFCNLRLHERTRTPEEALEELLGTMFKELGIPLPQIPALSFENQTALLLEQFEHMEQRLFLLIDHGECLMQEHHRLAVCWEHFFSAFLHSRHQAKIVLATRLWLGWTGNDPLFVDETTVPPLSEEQAVCLLQRLGLHELPVSLLQEVYHIIGGIPLCLEWVAALVKRPHEDDWESFEMEDGETTQAIASLAMMTSNLQRLLAGPRVFGGPPESVVTPFLERLLSSQSLSVDALYVLRVLSLAAIPLAKPALLIICRSGPGPYEELHRASLVVASRARTQLLPMVAVSVARSLSLEQIQEGEQLLIEAYMAWLVSGMVSEREAGGIVTELAMLQLKHYQLLSAAQVLVRYGWLAFNLGHAMRLARLARSILEGRESWSEGQRQDQAEECGKWLLHYLLCPYLGEKIDRAARAADYHRLLDLVIAKSIVVEPQTELFVIRHLMFYAMEQKRFADAQSLVDACKQRLAPLFEGDPDLQASLLEKQGYLYTNWCEHAEGQKDNQLAQTLRERAIAVYWQSNQVLIDAEARTTPLKSSILKKRLAKSLTNLGFHLNQIGQFEEAIEVLRQSISLKEQGYTDTGSLPASYGELSQALAALGQFSEALHYDELALEMIQRLADSGDTVSQETAWIYRVNRGRLYVRVERVDVAVRLLLEALPNIPDRWEMYRMFARQALDEIRQLKGKKGEPPPQYDARWVGDYRDTVAFDSFAMLSPTRFITEHEQEAWARLFPQREDPTVKKVLETMLADGKQSELLAAIQEGRQPRFTYPAIPLDEVRDRIRRLRALGEEIRRHEMNAVVRRFYIGDPETEVRGAIPYQVHFLQAIEATALGDGEAYWQHLCAISPPPTTDEMRFALSRVKWFILRGRELEHTRAVSLRLTRALEEQLSLSVDDLPDTEEVRATPAIDVSLYGKPATTLSLREVPPETVRNLLATLFREQGCQGWEAVIDFAARNTRIEPGLRHFIVAGIPYSIGKLIEQMAHEWEGHVRPRVAGERSLLGLLGIGTGWSLTTEEGLGLFYEMELAKRTGQRFDEAKLFLGTLATGLASGVLVPPQMFLSLYTFLAEFLLLYRLIFLGNEEMSTAQARARTVAQTRCLRTYRGVPDLSRPGICYPKDAVYERGLFQVHDAAMEDRTVLDWLAAGVVALEQIPDLEALGIPPATHSSLALLEQPDLEAYILSFSEGEPSAS